MISTAAPAKVLDRQHLFAAVFEPLASTAVFDCDGTLWGGDAGSGFMRWSISTGLVSREAVDWIDARYRGYLRGEVSEAAICGEMVQLYQGLHEDEMRSAARQFFADEISGAIFPEMFDLVTRLRTAGAELWAVSSTNRWVIEEGVARFGIAPERVLAAHVRVQGGVLTHELLAVPTDETKATALRERGVTRPDAVFGNSVHDAAMLRLARRPFAINPTTALREQAQAEGWPVFDPAPAQAQPTR